MAYSPELPYNDLPLLPPAENLETHAVLKKAISTHQALAKLVGSARQLPNQSMLIHAIALQEARLSSEIENILTTNDELYEAFALDGRIDNSQTKEVLHYHKALWQGFADVKRNGFLHTNLFIKLVQIIKETGAGIRNAPGTRITNQRTNETVYTPPVGEEVIRDKLRNLEDFINSEEALDPLIKMAVMHYQFEAIHPFFDGNGRVGRIINILYLINQNLLELPVIYLSRYIIDHKNAYYEGLRAVTEQHAWEPWILYMLSALEETARLTQHKIDSIATLMQQTNEALKERVPELYSKNLLEALFKQPYCKRSFIVSELSVSMKTAGLYLNKLEKAGFFKSRRVKKEKLYVNVALFQLLVSK